MSNYTADSIVTNEGLDVIRNSPTLYIVNREIEGQVHTAKELLDNGNDELAEIDSGVLTAILFKDRKNHRYQLLVSDTGRGIPIENDTLFRSLTTLNTSGKYDGDAYRGSGGLFGVGGKVPVALSTRYKALSFTKSGTGSIYLENSKLVSKDISPVPNINTGTVIIYEPDPVFYRDIPIFMETGYLDIINFFKLWKIFSNVRYVFKIVEVPISEHFWTDDINTSAEFIKAILNDTSNFESNIVYDSDLANNDQYLFEYFNIESAVTWTLDAIKDFRDKQDRIAYKIKIMMTKRLGSGCLGLLNNIFISNASDTHISVFNKTIYSIVAKYIENKDLQNFFLNYGYKLPIYAAISVRYDKYEVAGTIKNNFSDRVFGKQYEIDLKETLSAVNESVWIEMVSNFIEDLEDKYNKFYNKDLVVKNTGKLTLDLNYPDNFSPCEQLGMNSELFIVEGNSAGNIKVCRDSRFQAVECTRGKPENVITTISALDASSHNIRNNKIYKDIIRIIGYNPNDREVTKLNYGKIILTMDADPDGAHIVSLHTGNLYALNPNIIKKGYVWIATPPLYTMSLGKRGKKKYLRDYIALIDSKIKILYNTSLSVSISSDFHKPIPLKKEAFRDFCYLVIDFGKRLEYSAKLLDIPPLILERLLYGLEYITPNIDMNKLCEHFGQNTANYFVRLNYYEDKKILILSVENKDYPISLLDLDKEIKTNLLPYLKKYKFKKWLPLVTSKNKDGVFKDTPCTVMHVYMLFNALDKLITIERIKGLGRLSEEDVDITITNRKTRSLYHITDIGQVETICNLMGSNSRGRKDLLFNDGLLFGNDYDTQN